MQVQVYLNFDGRCEEAIEFYRSKLDAKVEMIMRFKDSPVQCDPNMVPPGSENKVMHSAFKIGESVIMATDMNCSGDAGFKGFSLTLSANSDAEAERLFAALQDGGQVQMPMNETFFATRFGVVSDRFGVSWQIIHAKPM